jgi:hypothetical protein
VRREATRSTFARWARGGFAALLLLGLGAQPACLEGERECYPSDWRACTCGDGAPGYEQCDAAGEGYGACDCSGTVPSLTTGPASSAASGGAGQGGAGGGGGAGGTPKKGFLEDCALDEECESGLCYNFNAKGPKCSLPCTGPADCPPPSPGCNMMGICKPS